MAAAAAAASARAGEAAAKAAEEAEAAAAEAAASARVAAGISISSRSPGSQCQLSTSSRRSPSRHHHSGHRSPMSTCLCTCWCSGADGALQARRRPHRLWCRTLGGRLRAPRPLQLRTRSHAKGGPRLSRRRQWGPCRRRRAARVLPRGQRAALTAQTTPPWAAGWPSRCPEGEPAAGPTTQGGRARC